MCSTVTQTLKNKTRIDTQIKFYKVMAVSAGLCASKNWVLSDKIKTELMQLG
jgi:hypothetical protein